jgi:hypothetical protein
MQKYFKRDEEGENIAGRSRGSCSAEARRRGLSMLHGLRVPTYPKLFNIIVHYVKQHTIHECSASL